jgi:hypothetical protein
VKTLVAKTEINDDRKLAIVKAFRIANKRAGEFKRAANEAQDEIVQESLIEQFQTCCKELHALAEEAERLSFHIWVNANGRTGHTYDKDYKPTSDSDNNFELFQAYLVQSQMTMQMFMGQLLPPDLNSQN